MIFHSIRWKLSLSFAGIALVTILALGAALLLPLRAYYRDQEFIYLKGNAASLALGLAPLVSQDEQQTLDLETHMKFLSFLAQARVRLVDMQGNLLADSGSPELSGAVKMAAVGRSEPKFVTGITGEMSAGGAASSDLVIRLETGASSPVQDEVFGMEGGSTEAIPAWQPTSGDAYPAEGNAVVAEKVGGLRFFYSERSSVPDQTRPGASQQTSSTRTLVSVVPVSKTMYGFELFSGSVKAESIVRSNQVFREQVFGADGRQVAWVELSEGPAYGYEIVTNVARGWALASLVAVLIAATVGWWISRRMSAPLLALTGVTRRMADGDLSARASFSQTDEFGSLGSTFNEMAGRVETTIATLRRFVSDAAHELHTPLTALRTNLELVQGADDPRRYLQRATEQVLRLEHLTNDLLDLSRIEGGSTDPECTPVDLGRLVAQVCEPYAGQAEQAGVEFELALPDDPLMVMGQESRLVQAVGNLVDNALKFTPPGGRVAVTAANEDGQAVVRVEDSGIGIAPEDLPILFQRFHRGRNTAGYPGSGLGLSIVKAVIERHAGTVSAESSGPGARFTLAIPLKRDIEL